MAPPYPSLQNGLQARLIERLLLGQPNSPTVPKFNRRVGDPLQPTTIQTSEHASIYDWRNTRSGLLIHLIHRTFPSLSISTMLFTSESLNAKFPKRFALCSHHESQFHGLQALLPDSSHFALVWDARKVRPFLNFWSNSPSVLCFCCLLR